MQILLSKTFIAALIMAAAISTIAFGYFHDQSIKGVYNSLTPSIYNDKNLIANQDSTISQLQNSVASRDTQISQLRSASVDGWFTFTGSQCYYGCNVNGAIANYGTQDAKNIVATLTWKNNGAFVQTNTLTFTNLAGRSLQLYPTGSSSQYFSLSAPANQLSWSFTWTT